MPVSVRHRRGRYRLVEPSGRLARNRAGTPIDGNGHETEEQARAQQRAVNRAESSKSLNVVKDHDNSVVLWVRVPDQVVQQLQSAVPFELQPVAHVTVLFYPNIESDEFAEVLAIALDLGLRSLPSTTARVTGFGDFQASEVSVALVSMPEIEQYRAVARGIYEPGEIRFGLLPHITLTSERHESVVLPPVEWAVTELEVVRGDRVLRTVELLGVEKQDRPPTTTQTLIFDKQRFPRRSDATGWARDHDFRTDKVDETERSWRLRQREPDEFVDVSFRTIRLTDGVQAVIGRLR